jgi:phthalate 4,5-dioxygenase
VNEQENQMVTRVEGGAPAGALLRRYWQPIALAEELDNKRPIKAVRVFGRDLVLFRGEDGLGLLDRNCPHRGADLAFGRLEGPGLRCTFHGWMFDKDGACLETPAEPVESKLCTRIRQTSYPVVERAGMIFAYLGDGAPPQLPPIDAFTASAPYTFAFKGLIECNWLQALEVGIDPSHASFLHRFFEDENPEDSFGKQFRDVSANSDVPITKVLREYDRPTIALDKTDFGLRIETTRALSEAQMHVRVTNLLFPNAFVIPMSPTVTITQWHTPVDDYTTYWYAIFTSYDEPLDQATMRAQRLELYTLPDYRSRRDRHNDYGFDIDEQATATFTGMGHDINVHDQWAIESQGRIQDRTKEHLGTSDKCIVAYRKLLMRSIKETASGGAATLMTEGDLADMDLPATIDVIVDRDDWQHNWRREEEKRRNGAAWVEREFA